MNSFPPYLQIAAWRELKYIPPHFFSIIIPFIPEVTVQENINKWIRTTLEGRFFVGETSDIVNGKIARVYKIAFEEDTEVTRFILSCPYYQLVY